jgi:hypothetical protein
MQGWMRGIRSWIRTKCYISQKPKEIIRSYIKPLIDAISTANSRWYFIPSLRESQTMVELYRENEIAQRDKQEQNKMHRSLSGLSYWFRWLKNWNCNRNWVGRTNRPLSPFLCRSAVLIDVCTYQLAYRLLLELHVDRRRGAEVMKTSLYAYCKDSLWSRWLSFAGT